MSKDKKQGKNKTEYTGRGASVYRAVTMSPDRNIDIAKRAGYEPNTMYGHFKKHFLTDAIMVKYGKAIPYDFAIEYPELADYFSVTPILNDRNYSELKNRLESIQSKYTALLEANNQLLIEYNKIRDELSTAKAEMASLKKKGK